MTIATNAFSTYAQIGIKEDVSNLINNISPDETPLYSTLKKFSTKNRLYQWQTDVLSVPAANAQLEGDVVSVTAATPTVLLQNYSQIAYKSLGVTDTAQAVATYGREDEYDYQVMKKGRELKTDVEAALLKNAGYYAGGTASARVSAGIVSFIGNAGLGTPNGGTAGSSAATSATTGTIALTYEMCSSAITQAYVDGGEPSIMMLGPNLKKKFSNLAFSTSTNTAVPRYNISSGAKAVTAVGTVDMWQSDFGLISVVPNRVMSRYTGESSVLDKAILFLDPKYARVGILQDMEVIELSKRGLTDEGFIRSEFCLEVGAPDAHAFILGAG
jgi:hypothetical protein